MNRFIRIFWATAATSIVAACGGGSDDPADKYVGFWRSACFSYVANDGNTYFARDTNNFAKATPTSLNVSFSDATAYKDPACNVVLAAISNSPSGTVQLGPKASFLGAEADSISAAFPAGNLVGYITANATQLFIIAEKPNVTLTRWGIGTPYTRIDGKQAPAPTLIKSIGSNDGLAPAQPLTGYSR